MRSRVSAPVALACLAVGCSDYEVKNLTVEDYFEQTEEPPADVLFVVDNSASMVEEQARLSENFGAFVALLGDTTADYRIGVTTTDPDDGGVLVGPVITPDAAAPL
jgi:Mg-chelatase subunit ChlD